MNKKTIFTIFLVLILFSSCLQQPRGVRGKVSKTEDEIEIIDNYGSRESAPSQYIDNTPTGGVEIPEDAKHCQFSIDGQNGFAGSSSHLGDYTICQSQIDERDIFLQLKEPIVGVRVCILPTFHFQGSSTSIYLGEPKCLYILDSKRVYKISLIKNRQSYGPTSFSSFPIKGVMVLKDESYMFPAPFNTNMQNSSAFMTCSEMLNRGDLAYCQAFKAVGQYLLKVFIP